MNRDRASQSVALGNCIDAVARWLLHGATATGAALSRRERGLTTVVVVAQARRQTAQARLNLTRASGDERTAYANLVAAIGLPADTRIDITNSSEQELPPEPPENLPVLIQEALRSRPDVIAALGKIEAPRASSRARAPTTTRALL